MDPVTAAYQEFPAWVFWLRYLFHIPAAFCVSFLAVFMGAWVTIFPLSISRNPHWAERARLLWPMRVVTIAAMLILPVVTGASWFTFGDAIGGERSGYDPLFLLCPFSAFAGAIVARAAALGCFSALPRREPGTPPDLLVTLEILYPHVCTTLLLGLLMPIRFGWEMIAVFLAAITAVAVIIRGGNVRLAHAMSIAVPAGERLSAIVKSVSARTGIQPSRVMELRTNKINAFALPSIKGIAFTRGLLSILSDHEIAAVAGHELAHIAEPRRNVLTRQVLLLGILPLVALAPVSHHFGIGAAAGLAIAVFVCLIIGRRISTRFEARADAGAKDWEPEPGSYAKALEKLHAAALLPAVMPARVDTHRNLYDRMISAGVQPAFPRPIPPSKATSRFAMIGTVATFFTCVLVLKLLFNVAGHTVAKVGSERGLMAVMALDGGGEKRLLNLSRLREANNDLRGALVFARAAVEAGEHHHQSSSHLAMLLARAGRCAEASAALHDARKGAWHIADDEPEGNAPRPDSNAADAGIQNAKEESAAAARKYVDNLPEIKKATEAVERCAADITTK